ncbi:SEC2 [Candida pseudojiufengensis]|uniref:SEC2 n=1 Tax=Candida pseudojiufengensis TaxID=497109 RepID=UPI002224154E|nr:SEC2 [Candida pseudojiufengensis]KAI5966772.1 SEC2 [Candida pseudojiufengensis]
MTSVENVEKRLTEEIADLSTRLMTEVNKQVEQEETILNLRKTIQHLKDSNKTLISNDENYKLILPKYLKLQDEFKQINIKKEIAETENKKLSAEVEDLTASLFDEANTMVSNASRETHNFKIKNKKLYEEIDEKNIIISNLQDQLQDLKQMFIKIEDQEKLKLYSNSNINTPIIEQENQFEKLNLSSPEKEQLHSKENDNDDDNEINDKNEEQLSRTIPNDPTIPVAVDQEDLQLKQITNNLTTSQITSIRFDLNNYNKDFKGFIYTLIKPDFILDQTHLKSLNFYKNIWNNEIENFIEYIPNLPQTSIFNKWQKTKIFWSSLIDGRVKIEPIKGFNENLKNLNLTILNPEFIKISIKEPCGFCGEIRSNKYEYCRLYHYKIYEIDESLIVSYPLCKFCLIKLRNLCEFFAKIRLLKSNIFKLKQNNQFDEFAYVPTTASNFYKRANSNPSIKNSNTFTPSVTTPNNEISNNNTTTTNTNSPTNKSDKLSVPSSSTSQSHQQSTESINSASSSTITTNSITNSTTTPNSDLMNGHIHEIKLDEEEEKKISKIYLIFLIIRLKIYYSKLGILNTLNDNNNY